MEKLDFMALGMLAYFPMPKPLRFIAFLLALLLAQSVRAGFIFDIDTATELSGSFEFTGVGGAMATTSVFLGLPLNTPNGLFASRNTNVVRFQTSSSGSPDPLNLQTGVASFQQTFPSMSGVFTNTIGGVPTYFLLYDLVDTGGDTGTWSGKFQFKKAVPDAGSTLGLFGLAVLGLAAVRRRSNR